MLAQRRNSGEMRKSVRQSSPGGNRGPKAQKPRNEQSGVLGGCLQRRLVLRSISEAQTAAVARAATTDSSAAHLQQA